MHAPPLRSQLRRFQYLQRNNSSTSTHQRIRRATGSLFQRSQRQVGIPFSHLRIRVPKDLLDLVNSVAGIDQERCELMPE
jgi:hypothetical protein